MSTTDLLSVAQAAGQLRVSERRVRALIEGGRLHASRVGASWVIQRKDLEAWAATRRGPGQPRKDRT